MAGVLNFDPKQVETTGPVETPPPAGSGGGGRAAVEAVVSHLRLHPGFLMPADICRGRLLHDEVSLEACGKARRALTGLLWLTCSVGSDAGRSIQRLMLSDARSLFGLAGRTDYRETRQVIRHLETGCVQPAEAGMPVRLFDRLALHRDAADGMEKLDVLVGEELGQRLQRPPIYALLDIRETVSLKKGLDFLLYQRLRLVWNMRRPADLIDLEDLRAAAGAAPGELWTRLSPAVVSSVGRVAAAVGAPIRAEPVFRGGRTVGLSIGPAIRKGRAQGERMP